MSYRPFATFDTNADVTCEQGSKAVLFYKVHPPPKVMFLHVSVILFTGGCAIPACIAGGIPACLAAGGVCSGGGLLPGRSALGGGGVWRHPRKQMATVADGMHPTGMHSCLLISISHSYFAVLGGVPGLRGYLVFGGYTWSGGCTLSQGGVPGPEGRTRSRGCTWFQGGCT